MLGNEIIRETVDYVYTIEGKEVWITFIDHIFAKCEFPFTGCYSFEQWHILKEIAQKIEELQIKHNQLKIKSDSYEDNRAG